MEKQDRAVLVTTEHRGVFYGFLVGEVAKAKVTLRAMRNITYWSEDVHSFVGLAATGPTKNCRISRPAGEESTVFDVTSVVAVTSEAAKRFEEAPWSK